MLSKLIKYDIRSTWRDFAGVYMAILLGVIIVPLLLNNVGNEFVSMFAGFISMSIVIATIVIMIVNLFKIFNTNVFSKEGYLTMTLPVTPKQIVISKMLVSVMWIILTGIVSVIGIFIFALIISPDSITMCYEGIQKLLPLLHGNGLLAFIMMILTMIVSSIKEIAKLFLACSIAHLKQLNRFRIPIGIASYFVFSWIETLITQSAGVVAVFIPSLDHWFTQFAAMTEPNDFIQFSGLFSAVMGVGILYSLLLTTAFSAGTIWILNRKLDLD